MTPMMILATSTVAVDSSPIDIAIIAATAAIVLAVVALFRSAVRSSHRASAIEYNAAMHADETSI